MRVLVAYASMHGATAEIAQAIGEELGKMGLETDVRPVAADTDVRGYGAVVLGSGIYTSHWKKEAMKFGKRNADELRRLPVWLFDSGPIDTSADEGKTTPVKGAAKLAERIGARQHVTFGGQLGPEDVGKFASSMIAKGDKNPYGDFRNFDRIREWARAIGTQLRATKPMGAGP